MIDIGLIQTSMIKIINQNLLDQISIRDFNIDNKPPYPFSTVQILTAYIPENENNKPNITQKFDVAKDKIIRIREENPTMVMSLNVYSDDETKAQQTCMNIISCLKFTNYNEFEESGIIVVEVSNPRNVTQLLEVFYEYRFQFDVTIRVESIVNMEIDYAEKITATNKNTGDNVIVEK